MAITELRLVLTVKDLDRATAFFRDALGGHATLEIADEAQARAIDRIEVGRRVAGPVRIALQTPDSEALAKTLAVAGATILAGPVITPWRDRKVRLQGPEGIQLTLFTPLGE